MRGGKERNGEGVLVMDFGGISLCLDLSFTWLYIEGRG